jgi:hypothetical protein
MAVSFLKFFSSFVVGESPWGVELTSSPRKRGSRKAQKDWIPAFAGMTMVA